MKYRRNILKSVDIWHVGLYIRLSKDEEKEGRDSIENQRLMLEAHFKKLQEENPNETYILAGLYIDNGETGTDSERAQFQVLLKGIEDKKINMVIFKNLSRLGRNYTECGYYLEDFFVKHKVRFVSLQMPYMDSLLTPDVANSPMVPIQNVFNDDWAKTCSMATTAVLDAKREAGQFIGAFAPYGFLKDPKNHNHLIVDPGAAPVVADIFNWFANEGMSVRGIAVKLNSLGVPNPAAYKRQILKLKYCAPGTSQDSIYWTEKTIAGILDNEMYIGNMVQGRQSVLSYKVHDRVNMPKEEWFVVEGVHEPIVDIELFHKVRALRSLTTKASPGEGKVHLFAGLLKCADCGRAMRKKDNKRNNYCYFLCRTYTDLKQCSSNHSIREDQLNKAVLSAIKTQISLVKSLSAFIAEINKEPGVFSKPAKIQKRLEERKLELNRVRLNMDDLYLDLKNNVITEAQYRRVKPRLESEEARLNEAIGALEEELNLLLEKSKEVAPYLETFLKYKNITVLDRRIVTDLIKVIRVYSDKSIEIDFKMSDSYVRILEAIEMNKKVCKSLPD